MPLFASTSSTPRSKSGGVVSAFAVRISWRPVSGSVENVTRSVKVPPTSVAARSAAGHRRGSSYRALVIGPATSRADRPRSAPRGRERRATPGSPRGSPSVRARRSRSPARAAAGARRRETPGSGPRARRRRAGRTRRRRRPRRPASIGIVRIEWVISVAARVTSFLTCTPGKSQPRGKIRLHSDEPWSTTTSGISGNDFRGSDGDRDSRSSCSRQTAGSLRATSPRSRTGRPFPR